MMFRTAQVIILAVIAVFVLAFLTRPLFLDIRGIQGDVSEYKEAVAQAEEFNELLAATIARQDSINASERDRLNALLSSDVDPVKSLVDIEALANVHGLAFETAGVTGSEERDSGDVLVSPIGVSGVYAEQISIDLLGTYEQFKAFLADLERSVPLVEVGDITFELAEGDLTRYTLGLFLPEWAPGTVTEASLAAPEEVPQEGM